MLQSEGNIWQPGSLSGAETFNRVSKVSKILIINNNY